MTGSFSDPEAIAKKAFDALSPGGWYEIQDIQLPVFCDDGTLDPETSPLMKWQECLIQGSRKIGRPLGDSDKYKAIVEEAGFHNVVETIYIWPTNGWPQDPKLKELGKWNLINFESGLEGGARLVKGSSAISLCGCEERAEKSEGAWVLEDKKLRGIWSETVEGGGLVE
ncbi:hypothetical protein J7337_012786 [Fusarium musae]|uniref:Methyltransferase n=1 Tax=Fusarium musae TaxID=1042133 RepID=A0A9P8IJU6_9HYPO|nr:hypothetical protein J7337_012786 [Fusarium musae]KAG9496205.1 hypothetical protein J7337_012786 [Fusarium musae]